MENDLEENGYEDPTWREPHHVTRKPLLLAETQNSAGFIFRFGLPSADRGQVDFSGPGGDDVKRALTSAMTKAVKRLESIGGTWVRDFDFKPFEETASLLYQGPFVAERYSGIRRFLEGGGSNCGRNVSEDDRLLGITRSIISNHSKWNATDVFTALEKLAHLKAAARTQMGKVDIIVVPTVPHYYTVKSVIEEENNLDGAKNTSLGRFTNFVNLLDLCGISVPSAIVCAEYDHLQPINDAKYAVNSVKLPFGVTLLAPAWCDAYVARIAQEFERQNSDIDSAVGLM
jgi:allophanate hydrolase